MKNEGYQIRNQSGIHFVTFTVIDWIDVFTRQLYRDIFLESLKFCQKNKGLLLYAYVIMSNHIHLILAAENSNLSQLIGDIKQFTSKKILKAITENPLESRKEWLLNHFNFAGMINNRNEKQQFWIQDNHPIELNTNELTNQKLKYIHENPVKNGLVFSAEDYVYSSASSYAGREGLIEVLFLN